MPLFSKEGRSLYFILPGGGKLRAELAMFISALIAFGPSYLGPLLGGLNTGAEEEIPHKVLTATATHELRITEAGETIYRVVPGDTLYGLARRFFPGLDVDEAIMIIRVANNMAADQTLIRYGQDLVIPDADVPPTATPAATKEGEIVHVVQSGENLFRIGLRYGFTAEELAAYNGIRNVDVIDAGQRIKIPPSN